MDAHIRPLDAGALAARSGLHLSQSRHRRRAAAARARRSSRRCATRWSASRRASCCASWTGISRCRGVGESRLREASGRVAPFLGVAPGRSRLRPQRHDRPERGAAIGAARAAATKWSITDLAYGAVDDGGRRRARASGARRSESSRCRIRCGDAGDVVEAIVRALTPRTRLVVVDHVTAQTALVLPVAAIAAECRARGVPVLVDGAHAPGSIAARHSGARRRLVFGEPAQVGARAPRLRHSLGGARASGHAPSSHRLLGLRPGVSRGVRAPGHERSDELPGGAGGHRAAARVGLRRRACTTCTVWRGRPPAS